MEKIFKRVKKGRQFENEPILEGFPTGNGCQKYGVRKMKMDRFAPRRGGGASYLSDPDISDILFAKRAAKPDQTQWTMNHPSWQRRLAAVPFQTRGETPLPLLPLFGGGGMSQMRHFSKTKPLWIHPGKVPSGSYIGIYV